jgi:uncharacterized protein with PQ loop repeat
VRNVATILDKSQSCWSILVNVSDPKVQYMPLGVLNVVEVTGQFILILYCIFFI